MTGLYIILGWLILSVIVIVIMAVVNYKENKKLEEERERYRNGQ